jgi:hypothetical protein
VFDDGSTYEESRRRYNDIVRVVASQSSAALADIEAEFPSDDQLARLLLDPPDVLHLTSAGHAVYAALLGPILEDALAAAARDVAVARPAGRSEDESRLQIKP